ncbi:MAG: hypothetical protein BZY79_04860 [SAR202 cluster bacterium Casp-Chloro-G4]|nr:AAA family ATPase [Chloroflexota bacterium]PKB61213.1 MAG: hypothetical protein BZY79_04860 [SAR202 cluster bacterium Casp-Chloro-G4]
MPTLVERRYTLVDALLRPEAYPDEPTKVTLLETHVSYLFFVDDVVYKVKKPVDYGFLDFTNLGKRRFYCDREVALNSRMSPDVYMGVVPIRQDGNDIRVEGPGKTIEYAVKMHRLDADKAVSELLRRGLLTSGDVRAIARKVARFHETAATGTEVNDLGDLSSIRRNIEENFEQTERFIGKTITSDEYEDLVEYSRAFMRKNATMFRLRTRQGRIRDGHGDLHASNIFLGGEPEAMPKDGLGAVADAEREGLLRIEPVSILPEKIHIIDCIEFNDRFRCADVAEDIAFLAMDLDYFGRPDLSREFVEAYVEASGDTGVMALMDFFKTYRAYVRGKVTSFRLDNPDLTNEERLSVAGEAEAYFRLARSYALLSVPRPALFIVGGLMGTGKSSIAEELANRWDLHYISSDLTRKRLADVAATQHRYEEYGEGIYSAEYTRMTYEVMLDEARGRLASGEPVVVDATFRAVEERQRFSDAAASLRLETFVVECTAAEGEIKRRLEARITHAEETISDGRWELYRRQQADWEPITEVRANRLVQLDTTGPRSENLRKLVGEIFFRVM